MPMVKARHIRHPVGAARSAERLLRLHLDMFRRARDAERIYKFDPRFRLEVVEQGFRPLPDSDQCDRDLLRRISEAYKAATANPIGELYRPTEWWETIRRTSLQPVIQALETGDIDALHLMYSNFFRDPCSDGLVSKNLLLRPSLTRPFTRFHRAVYLGEALYRLDSWKSLTRDRYKIHNLTGPVIGNPFGIAIDGMLVRTGAEQQHYCAHRITDLIGDANSAVVEIGGGYGGMAYYLLRDRPQTAYIDFDLPESLALAAYYLIKSFPEKRFLLCGEASATNIDRDDFDVALLPVAELSFMPPGSADVVFSSHTMSDLGSEALRNYVMHVASITKKYFLYEGMHLNKSTIHSLIRSECPNFVVKDEKRFRLSGATTASEFHSELLYENIP